ncbi:hypothetical protein [Amycolatopsis methanolica]|uniref:Uncharacterized protein n=1 Tax=Amycolatopsis methanolica 239 TaxID=1068978 RepID=A0A076MQH5_AMYME|nr:hypothetical protein [Amycolatopsis methanolica]AIJ23133.1 hypothetical protein AMETH_3041 [Amycolatopsis methanolica 239]
MDYVDPARNLISFTTGGGAVFAESAPAQAVDAFRQVWERVSADHGVEAGDVTRIEAYWQPARWDERYLTRTFGDVELEYVFPRPDPGGWHTALDRAREVLDEVAAG